MGVECRVPPFPGLITRGHPNVECAASQAAALFFRRMRRSGLNEMLQLFQHVSVMGFICIFIMGPMTAPFMPLDLGNREMPIWRAAAGGSKAGP